MDIANINNLIKHDDEYVSQVLPLLPSEGVLRQACFLYFNYDTSRNKIRSPIMFFLLLLLPFEQIKDALDYIRGEINSVNELYLIECIKNTSAQENFLPYQIMGNKERLILTKNALVLIDSL
ncbi:hypothetical protein SULI_06445 [Saccharolobus solfataricus]|uniref:Uncharacterized protein n=3 Tax=Saccharolobus solfataricus TaxID=2287 RepID=Q980K9_SACS2|nr:hypothetical protein [Saccharolobus solfataricus]AAK40622.1 Hypothetical protein SSO0284 [Saccharolobus solfataricus P2]AKA73599.1 hypothetical protein SULB_1302 [Saccharolobus solfataricus]AKA76297.1 hypothetical protein SULC_1300 [Saccharolobus solfataricus]AKA78989.1 hypothetical protein SULA_1301 [Saccharolobus solfataricus]AZF68067.1 hypothetical protein SULG_06445 [Saccharolobus solfataricus]